MLSRDSEDEMWSRFVFELVIWLQEVTLARWTQPSGPLCLWQCFQVCLYNSKLKTSIPPQPVWAQAKPAGSDQELDEERLLLPHCLPPQEQVLASQEQVLITVLGLYVLVLVFKSWHLREKFYQQTVGADCSWLAASATSGTSPTPAPASSPSPTLEGGSFLWPWANPCLPSKQVLAIVTSNGSENTPCAIKQSNCGSWNNFFTNEFEHFVTLGQSRPTAGKA